MTLYNTIYQFLFENHTSLKLKIKSFRTLHKERKKLHCHISENPSILGKLEWLANLSLRLLSVQFSLSVVSNSLCPHGLQHARLLCPSPTPRVCSKSCPLSLVMTSNHLIICRPLFLLPLIFPSIKVISNESALPIRWSKYWSFSFNISLFNEYLGLISFRMDWLELLAVQGTLKRVL